MMIKNTWQGLVTGVLALTAGVAFGWIDVEERTGFTFKGDDGRNSYAELDKGNDVADDLVIPESAFCWDRIRSVVAIGEEAFKENAALTSVSIPDCVRLMGFAAFEGCSSLTNAVLGTGLTEIPPHAFCDCSSLKSVRFGANVKSIGDEAFAGCSGLTSIELPEGVTHLGEGAFAGCVGLTEVVLPEGLTHLGKSAFEGCTSLVRVVVPSTLKVIEADAFKNCTSLTTVAGDCDLESCAVAFDGTPFADPEPETEFRFVKVGSCIVGYKGMIPQARHELGNDRYEHYVGTIRIPEGVTAIADHVFDERGFSESYHTDTGLEISGYRSRASFKEYGDGRLVLPASLKVIGECAFRYAMWLKKVEGGESVSFVGKDAFLGTMYTCQEKNIPVGFLSAAYLYYFEGVNKYRTFRQVILGNVLVAVKGPWPSEVVISNGVKRISTDAFCLEKSCYTAKFDPDGLALANDTSMWMRSLKLPSSLERIDEDAFSYDSLKNLESLEGGENLHDFVLDDNLVGGDHPFFRVDNPLRKSLESRGGLLRLGDTVFGWLGDYPVTMEIPEGVAVIADGAFALQTSESDSSTLRNVFLPSTLKRIGVSAFSGQRALESPEIPEGVESVGAYAFAFCTGMHELTLPSSLKEIGIAVVHNEDVSSVSNVTFRGDAPRVVTDDSRYSRLYDSIYRQYQYHGKCPLSKLGGTVSLMENTTGWIAADDCAVPGKWPWLQSDAWAVKSTWSFDTQRYETEYGGFADFARLVSVGEVKPVMAVPSKSGDLRTVGGIGPQAFGQDAATLTELTIPSSVRHFADDAFAGCESLAVVHAFSGVEDALRAALDRSGLDVAKITLDLTPWRYRDDGAGGIVEGVVLTGVDQGRASELLAGDVTLPSEVFGYPVVGLSDFNEDYDDLVSLTLPDSVKYVYDAFGWSFGLEDVALGAGVVYVAPGAFRGPGFSFGGLSRFSVASGNGFYKSVDGVLFSKDGKTLERCPVGSSGEYAVPDGVTRIRRSAFEFCGQITRLTLPASVREIGSFAFENCTALTAFAVADDSAVYASVDGMLLSKDGTRLERMPCGKAGTAVVPEGVTTVGVGAFRGAAIRVVDLPTTLTHIEDDAFSSCGLDELIVRSSEVTIGFSVFTGADRLYAVFSSEDVRETLRPRMEQCGLDVGDIQFLGVGESPQVDWTVQDDGNGGVVVTGLSPARGAVVIPDAIDERRVTAIGANFIDSNDRIASISLPGGLSEIGSRAFSGCENVADVVWRGTGPAVIGDHAFAYDYGLTGKLVLPEGVREIGMGAFWRGAWTSVTLPNSLTNIQGYAFCDSMSLTDLTFGTGIEAIGENAFLYCDTLKTVRVPPEKLTLVQGALTASGLDVTKITFVTDGACQLPELPPDATSDDVAEALAGAADSRLAENIADVAAYNAFRAWAQSVPGGDAAVLASSTAWTSFALDAASLLARQPTDDALTAVSFAPSATAGRFDFVVSVKDVTVGGGATSANLLRILGIEGATTLSPKDFRPENATVDLAAPSGGNVRLTVGPVDADAPAFFMRARVNK